MDDLRKDWKAVKAKDRRRPAKLKKAQESPLDLHDCWAAVKGQRFPPIGYMIHWPHATVFAIFKYAITSKYKARDGVYFKAVYQGVLWKTPGYKVDPYDVPKGVDGIPRSMLCFTQEEVERKIERERRGFIYRLAQELPRQVHALEEAARQLKYTQETIRLVSDDPLPYDVLAKLPRKPSKRVT